MRTQLKYSKNWRRVREENKTEKRNVTFKIIKPSDTTKQEKTLK